MAILNQDSLFYLETYNPNKPKKEARPNSVSWILRDYNDHDYYCFEFFNGDVFDFFPIETLLTSDQIARIKNREVFLVVSNTHEGYLRVVDGLYQSLVIKSQLPPEQIILQSETVDAATAVKMASEKYGVPEFKVEWTRIFEKDIQGQTQLLKQLPKTLVDKPYQKKFLNLNRRWRAHRPAFVALLAINNLLEHGYVSLGKADDNRNWTNLWPFVKFQHNQSQELMQLFLEHEKKILALPELYLDTEDLTTNRAELSLNTIPYYENSYLSIVSETYYYTNAKFIRNVNINSERGRFFSEKTFKPISQKHPFIIISVPKMLDSLKSIGYKTFSPWIDESYDDEFDDSRRLLKIANETKRLCNLTPSELTTFLDNVRPICEHNYNTLMSKTIFVSRTNY